MIPVLQKVADADALAAAALTRLRDALAGTQGERVVCLSGGRTPRPFYCALAREIRAGRLAVGRVHWVIGDERAVPVDHPRSNFGMIRQSLFDPAGIPSECIHPMPADRSDLAAAARAFERDLQQLYGAPSLDPDRPLFDFNLLGLGEDGHTASLFPGSEALAQDRRWVVPTRAPDGERRLSLTFPVLNSSRHAVVLVEGAGKQEALARWMRGDPAVPAARLAPPSGVTVLADEAAAGS